MSKKNKGGRRGKFHEWLTEEGLIKIEGWAKDGLTNEQIAHNIGITSETLRVWSNKYSVLSVALKKGKEIIDRQVENALLKRALGYTYAEVTREPFFELNEETGEKERVMKETKVVTKEVQPDVTAQIFWLKNRKPKQWRDKQDIEHSGVMTNQTLDLSHLSDEELEKALSKYGDA